MSILAEAVKYIELGWSVIPIIEGSKRPSRAWKEYQEKRMTAVEAIEAFSGASNIGLVCGDISGVLVIDDDSYKKAAGEEAIKLDTPLFCITPRGGKHYYFRYCDGGNTVNQALAMDIRSKGGYVLLPPSFVRYENGDSGYYTWENEPSKEILDTLPDAPESVLRAIYGSSRPDTHSDPISPLLEPFRPPFETSSMLNVKEGGRNNSLSRLALSVLNKYDEVTAWSLIQGANKTFSPPLDDKEVLAVFGSALKKFKESPPVKRGEVKPTVNTEPVVNSDFKKTTLREDLTAAKKVYMEGKTRGESTGFSKLDALIGGFISGQSYLVYADTSVGKSIFTINMLVALAKRGVKTIYFDLENPIELTIERLAFVSSAGMISLGEWRTALEGKNSSFVDDALSRVETLSLDVWDVNKLTDRFGDITWAGVRKCIEEAVDSGVRIVVIDHLHYFSPSETDHAFLGEVMRQVNNLCAQYNISIVVVAHTKKGLMFAGKDDVVRVMRPTIDHISGSGLIGKHCKNIIALQRNAAAQDQIERQTTTVFVDKTKFGPTGEFKLRFSEDQLCFFDDGVTDLEKQVKKSWEEISVPVSPQPTKEDPLEGNPFRDEIDSLVNSGTW